jgi:UDP-N-acetylmuramate--alanine ligase
MMKQAKGIQTIQTYFFVGIGGIGMSALARYFHTHKSLVYGYDRTASTLTKKLEQEGISIYFNEDEAIQVLESLSRNSTFVVYTPAISKQSKLWKCISTSEYNTIKRAELLGKLTENKFCLAVAGTHGKTTTTSILTHILKENKIGVTAFLGGILTEEQTNYISTGEEVYVVEADEFDRSFLQLYPTAAVITSVDADHLEIYGTAEALVESFTVFSEQVSGQVFTTSGIQMEGKKIGFSETDDVYAKNISVENGSYVFDLVYEGETLTDTKLSLPGKHNLFNALSAVALAAYFRPNKWKEFADALAGFKGVQRRFNYLLQEENLSIIDDYAHHPTEIAAAHQAAKEMHPNENLMLIFQPHLFSRTQKFADDFAQSLMLFDEICLLEIYPAREEPIDGIDAAFLAEKVKLKPIKIIEKSEMLSSIQHSTCKVVLLLGAGDIGVEAQKIKRFFNHEMELE